MRPHAPTRACGRGASGALAGADAPRVRLDDLRRAGPRRMLGLLRGGRYDRCVVHVNDFRAQGRWLSVIALALAARADRRVLVDPEGRQRPLTLGSALLRELPCGGWRALTTGVVLARALRAARALRPAGPPRSVAPRRVLFVRSDLSPPLTAGGSLAHILGVLSGLERLGVATSLLTPGPVLDAEQGGRTVRLLPPDDRFRLSQELPPLAYDTTDHRTAQTRTDALQEAAAGELETRPDRREGRGQPGESLGSGDVRIGAHATWNSGESANRATP